MTNYLLTSKSPPLFLADELIFLSFPCLLFGHLDDVHGLSPWMEMISKVHQWVFLQIMTLFIYLFLPLFLVRCNGPN